MHVYLQVIGIDYNIPVTDGTNNPNKISNVRNLARWQDFPKVTPLLYPTIR